MTLEFWTYFTLCSSVTIVNFERVIAGYDELKVCFYAKLLLFALDLSLIRLVSVLTFSLTAIAFATVTRFRGTHRRIEKPAKHLR